MVDAEAERTLLEAAVDSETPLDVAADVVGDEASARLVRSENCATILTVTSKSRNESMWEIEA